MYTEAQISFSYSLVCVSVVATDDDLVVTSGSMSHIIMVFTSTKTFLDDKFIFLIDFKANGVQ